MDKIVWQLGADSSKMFAEMDRAIAGNRRFTVEMEKSFQNVDVRHEKFLRSGHTVARQVSNIAREFASGASAGDIFATSLEGIGRSLNLSLGALAALGVGAVIIQKATEANKEYKKLLETLKEVHKQASLSGDFQTANKLEEGAKKAQKAVEELQNAINNRSGGGGLGGMLGQAFNDASRDLLFLPTKSPGKTDEENLTDAKADRDALVLKNVDKRRQQSDLVGASTYDKEVAQAAIKYHELNSAVAEQTQALIELTNTVKAAAKKHNDMKMERAGASLAEMNARGTRSPQAALGFNEDWSAMDPEKFRAIKAAQGVMAQRAAAEAQRLDLNPDAAHEGFNQAGEAAEGIKGLKPSEKMASDFKGALQVTEENTAATVEAIKLISFAGK